MAKLDSEVSARKRKGVSHAQSAARQQEPLGRSPKRRRADGAGATVTNGAHDYRDDGIGRVNPAFKRRSSGHLPRNAASSQSNHGFNSVNNERSIRQSDSEDDSDDDDDDDDDKDDDDADDTSNSSESDDQEVPTKTSLAKFNSNNVRLAKPVHGDSSGGGEASESDFNFSQKPTGKNLPKSNRFVYDDASDLSSGEETSIPGTISHSKSIGGEQSASGKLAVASDDESDSDSDSDSVSGSDSNSDDGDEDLDEKSYRAVKSSQGGVFQSTKVSRGSGKIAKDKETGRGLPDAAQKEPSDAGTEESSAESSSKQSSTNNSPEPALAEAAGASDAESESSDSEKESTPTAEVGVNPSPRPKKARPRSVRTSQSSERDRSPRQAPSSRPSQGPERKGPLASLEDQTLSRTIKKFLAANRLTDDQLPSLVKGEIEDIPNGNRLHEKLWTKIYESLPDRTPRYVRAIIKRRHTDYSAKKEWTREDDEQLVELAKDHDTDANKWMLIGQKLGRTANECRDRHRNYAVCGEKRTIGPWKADDLLRLLRAVSEFVPEDAEDGDLDEDEAEARYRIDWLRVSADMEGIRSRKQCLVKWKSMDVGLHRLRVRQLLRGRQPEMSPELRIVLMQVYSQPEETLRRLVQAVGVHEVEGDRPILWRQLAGGRLAKAMKVETMNIIWVRLRKGLAREMLDRSDQDVARRIYDVAIEEKCLEDTVAQNEDVGTEEELVRKPWKGLSTNASYGQRE